MQANDGTSERLDEPTPNGGAYSVAYFRDKEGRPCRKEHAHQMEIVEYDDHDNEVHRTHMVRDDSNDDEEPE